MLLVKTHTINEIRDIVIPIAKKRQVDRIYLFGSYARGDATEKSDIDFRVDPGTSHSFFKLGGLYSDLEDAFNKKIDLVTTGSLDKNFLNEILKEEILIYDKYKN